MDQAYVPFNHVLLDYKYTIIGCSLSTFHRDVTSGQRYHKTIHPTYTLIHYQYDGDFLAICEDNSFPFTWSFPTYISGKKGTWVLFNADMLHAGQINKCGMNRFVTQYKVCHKDDVDKLTHLNGINVTKTNFKQLPYWMDYLLFWLSYWISFWTNTFGYVLLQKKYDDGFAGFIQNWIPISFYNNV